MARRPVAPPLSLAEIELRLDASPRISLGVSALEAARRYAQRLRELLGDPDVTVVLGEAYRLLDTEVNVRTWDCPYLENLLPELRALAWGEALAGHLRITGRPADNPLRGRRMPIPAERLATMEPDFEQARLLFEGRAAVVAVQIEPAPPVPQPVQVAPGRRRVSEAEMRTAILQIYAEEPGWFVQLGRTEEEIRERIERLSGGSVFRKPMREALNELVPGLNRGRGRPRKSPNN
jgi:hypothetical protein